MFYLVADRVKGGQTALKRIGSGREGMTTGGEWRRTAAVENIFVEYQVPPWYEAP